MAHGRGLETLLFWVVILIGTAILVPCLLLPPWLDYQTAYRHREAAGTHVETLERRLRGAEKRLDRLQNDDTYVLRLAEDEFGETFRTPSVETIHVDIAESQPAIMSEGEEASGDPVPLPEVATFVDHMLDEYPITRLYVSPHTRPVLMAIGAAVLLSAIVLVGRPRRARQPSRNA